MMNLSNNWRLEKYNPSLENEWDYFMDNNAINSTFLHTRRFYNHNPLNNRDDCSFMFLKKGKIRACIPAVILEVEGRKIWNSHMRATYGGLIISENIGVEDVLEITHLLENELISNRVDEAIIRNPFRVFNRKFCDEFDYSLWKNGFVLKSREIEIGVSLSNKSYKEIESQYQNGNKYNIKKALKNVEVKFSNDYSSFWNLLQQNLLQRHNLKPVHNYGKHH
jgi:hypothetical protein